MKDELKLKQNTVNKLFDKIQVNQETIYDCENHEKFFKTIFRDSTICSE